MEPIIITANPHSYDGKGAMAILSMIRDDVGCILLGGTSNTPPRFRVWSQEESDQVKELLDEFGITYLEEGS